MDEATKKEIGETEKRGDEVNKKIDELEREIVKCQAEIEVESIELERMDEDIVCMAVVIESGKLSLKKRVKEEMRKTEEEKQRMKRMQELEDTKAYDDDVDGQNVNSDFNEPVSII